MEITNRKCSFCERGNYQYFVEQNQEDQDKVFDLGLKVLSRNEWIILICDSCGNLQFFRPDLKLQE